MALWLSQLFYYSSIDTSATRDPEVFFKTCVAMKFVDDDDDDDPAIRT